jgi:glycine betaine catabolism B
MRAVIVGEKELLLVKFAGKCYAFDERCAHRGGPLSEGSLDDGSITCPWHFGQFEIETGNVRGPPPTEPLMRYDLIIEDGNILVSIA